MRKVLHIFSPVLPLGPGMSDFNAIWHRQINHLSGNDLSKHYKLKLCLLNNIKLLIGELHTTTPSLVLIMF